MTALAPSLEAACEPGAGRPAVTAGGDTVSYAELGERIRRLAGAFAARGVAPGDRILVQLPNSVELLVAMGAAWACGAVHVAVDRDLTGPELAALVERTDPAVVVYQAPPDAPDALLALRLVRASRPRTFTVFHGGAAGPRADATIDELLTAAPLDGRVRPWSSGGDDRADLLLLTSGTTATPKLVMETLPALWAKVACFADAYAPGVDDVHLLALPMAHAFGLKLALTALATGGRLVLQPRFSPDEALRLIGEEGVTILPGTPTHFAVLLARLDPRHHRTDTLRWAVSAAAPFPRRVLEQVYATLGVRIFHVYGSSEGFLTVTSDRDDILAGSAGRTVFRGPEGTPPNGTVAVVDRDTSTPVAPGEAGEIVYGARRPVRYWGEAPVATDGWYHTGDLGTIDADGRLCVTGRLKDVVNRGGLKVACGEVEAALLRHPAVAETAVVPVPDPVLGEAICACVVVAEDAAPDLAEIRSFLGERLARHKLPDQLCVLSALPRSKVGKLDRPALAGLMADGRVPGARLRA